MEYAYGDWSSQATAAERLTRLRAHIAEVTAEMRPDVQSGGTSVNRQGMVQYHRNLMLELREAERAAAAERNRGIVAVRGRPV